jgi:hypothetical protein
MPIYLRARYCDPLSCRAYLQRRFTATTRHPYAYVSDNPLNRTHPTGLYDYDLGHLEDHAKAGIAYMTWLSMANKLANDNVHNPLH